jgi:hypothetical protein
MPLGHPYKRPFVCTLSICRAGLPGETLVVVSPSVLDRKFRIKAVQSCHSDRYCSGKLRRTQGGNPRRRQLARQRHSHRGRGTGGHSRPPCCATRPLAHPSASVTAAYPGPPHRIRTFRPNAAPFRSNGVVSAPMRTREAIETNRYTFRLNAECDTRAALGRKSPSRGLSRHPGRRWAEKWPGHAKNTREHSSCRPQA